MCQQKSRMKKCFFITGTDTGVGKTCATIALMQYFKQQGQTVVGMKPISAGCEWIDGQLKNEDALLIQKNATIQLPYEKINPYAFELPVSPHLAGKDNPVQIDTVVQYFEELSKIADVVLVEGAGGWLAPINNKEDIADLAKALDIPVILVVAIKLGCINHAKLTFQSIMSAGVKCNGWLAMCIEPDMLKIDENIETLRNYISVPLLGVFPFMENIDFKKLSNEIFKVI